MQEDTRGREEMGCQAFSREVSQLSPLSKARLVS